MAEPTTGETKRSGAAPKKELSTEMRMLLAFLLMGAVLFFTPYFYKTQAPSVKKAPPQAQKAPAPVAPVEPKAQTQTAAEPIPAIAGGKEEIFTVDTDLYHVVFSNRGAVVRSWTLKKYDNLELVNTAPAPKLGYPFALVFKDRKPSADLNGALYAAKPSPDGLGIEYEFSNGKLLARKAFHFRKESYLSEFSSEVSENGVPIPHLISWRGGFGDTKASNAASNQHTLHFDLSEGKLIVNDLKTAKNGPVTATGAYSFAGVEDKYFAAVCLPGNSSIEIQTMSDAAPSPSNPTEEPHIGVALGGEGRNQFPLYVGPKDIDILRRVNPKLEQMVDFGWFAFIAKPLFLAVHWVNDRFVHNYGWSIILVTIFINFVLFPLKIKTMKSSKKMQALQPQIAAINAKYKDVSIRDPRKQQQNQEVMELYKKHGVNPMGGCMPMLLQIPFFIAFYKVLDVSIEMRGAHWLWVTDLSRPESLPIHILPIIMVVTQIVMQKMTPSGGMDPSQQKLMLLMPLVMGYMFYWVSSGLVLYWLTSNLVGIAQQWFFNRTGTAADLVKSVQPVKKKDGRK